MDFLVSKKKNIPNIFLAPYEPPEGWYLEVQEIKKQGVGETQRPLKRGGVFWKLPFFSTRATIEGWSCFFLFEMLL